MENLQDCFKKIMQRSDDGLHAQDRLWNDITRAYSACGRHYHTLQHLDQMYSTLSAIQDQLQDTEVTWLALCYHDIIYDASRQDNEEQSAAFAKEILDALQLPAEKVQQCIDTILATKAHTVSADMDINYFTDADLSILGQDWERYIQYAKDIRKEYAIYPDEQYYPGRARVIQHFLDMPRLFKTEYFYGQYEEKARENLAKELQFYEGDI
jgi:predicted metal-dependent HD superfamily phosphohydrolase